MTTFLTGTGALWLMTALCVIQAIAFMYVGKIPQALVMVGYAVADLGVIWSL